MAGMEHASSGVSVTSLDTPKGARPDVIVTSPPAGRVKLASGKTVEGYTINGRYPGPTIEATVGQVVEVSLHNADVEGGVSLHWHGVDVPNAEDGVAGVTQDAVKPGQDYTYRWVAPHVGTFWYHSHQMSHEQVSGGLLGGIVIRPPRPVPGVVDQLAVSHLYDSIATLNGDTGYQPVPARPGQRVRVRVVNTDNGPSKAWASVPFKVVARTVPTSTSPTRSRTSGSVVRAAPGWTSSSPCRARRDGCTDEVAMGRVRHRPPDGKGDVNRSPRAQVDLLKYGSPARRSTSASATAASSDLRRKPGFSTGSPACGQTVNGNLFPDVPMLMVQEGDVVRHDLHPPGDVTTRSICTATTCSSCHERQDDDRQPRLVGLHQRAAGRACEVAFIADNPGIWMDHCHNLVHAALGMVTHLMYEGVTTPYKLGSDSGNEPE